MMSTLVVLAAVLCAGAARGGVTFRVVLDSAASAAAVDGRLVVHVTPEGFGGSRGPAGVSLLAGARPMAGEDVVGLAPGEAVLVGDGEGGEVRFMWDALEAGVYRAQAVLDRTRARSDWWEEPGNLYSGVARFEVTGEGREVELRLTREVGPERVMRAPGLEFVEVRSALVSAFRGEEVVIPVGVVEPIGYEAGGSYASVYVVPGFGGDHRQAVSLLRARLRGRLSEAERRLAERAFFFVLDPEGPSGHHLFADSANNGPMARALVEEVVAELERRYPVVADREARLVRGHSSGGWSAVWLTLTEAGTFGGGWASAPDPLDFRAFQRTDIYGAGSVYERAGGGEVASKVTGSGEVVLTVREENLMEEVLGPGNTSAQQWDSWQAVFGPRGEDGNPAALFDVETGEIDRAVAAAYRAYDVSALLAEEPGRVSGLLRERVRVLAGAEDEFGLGEGARLLKERLDGVAPMLGMEVPTGYIEVVEGAGHGVGDDERFAREMETHLRRAGLWDGLGGGG